LCAAIQAGGAGAGEQITTVGGLNEKLPLGGFQICRGWENQFFIGCLGFQGAAGKQEQQTVQECLFHNSDVFLFDDTKVPQPARGSKIIFVYLSKWFFVVYVD
jgi:hypothetical protein